MKLIAKPLIIILILLISGFAGFSLSLYKYYFTQKNFQQQKAAASARTFHTPISFVKQIQNDPDAGRKIFKEYCAACHANPPLIDVHAPLIGDKNVWLTRKKKGLNGLMNTTINGKNAMPARGGCFECSDAQLKQAVEYMLK